MDSKVPATTSHYRRKLLVKYLATGNEIKGPCYFKTFFNHNNTQRMDP